MQNMPAAAGQEYQQVTAIAESSDGWTAAGDQNPSKSVGRPRSIKDL
jgi:hypothetical protein